MKAPALALGLCLMLTSTAVADESLNVRFVGGWPCPTFTYSVALDSARNRAFVGAENGIGILDISNPASPVELSRVWTRQPVNGLHHANGRLYVANDAAGLRIVSVADPEHPVELGYYDDVLFGASGVSVAGNYAYVAAGYLGLSVISVGDPAHPREVGRYDTPGSARGVEVSGENAYVADGDSGLRIISVTDPAHPVEVGHCSIPNAAIDVAASGDYAYVASDSFGLRVISISDPTHPTEVGYCDTTPALGRGVAVAGDYAYFARDTADMRIISIADPARPVEIGYCGTPGFAWDVAVLAGNAYVADYGGGLRVISVTDPAHPFEVGSYDPPDEPWRVAVTGDHAYMADGPGGLLVISVADSARPVKIGQCGTPGHAFGVAVSGDYAYVTDGSPGLRVISVADAAHPVEVGHIDLPSRAWSVAVVGGLAYVADDTSGLRIISVSDPAHPTEVGFCDALGGLRGVAVIGQYAYVADHGFGLRIVCVADPAHPAEVGHCDLPGRAFDVAAKGDYAYVADGSSGLRVVSIADPAHPVEVGFHDTLYAYGVALSRDYAYVADRDGGLRVLSVTDPAQPTEVGYYATRLSAKSVSLNGGYAYVVSTQGLEILRFYGGPPEQLGDLDVDPDSLDVAADTLRLKGSGSSALGAFVLANTSAAYNPDPEDGPSLSWVDSLRFTGTLTGPGGTLDSILIPNLPTSLAQGQTVVCTLAVFVPVGLPDGDYSGSITIAGKDVNGVLIQETFYALIRYKPGDLDVDNDSLDVVADTVRVRPRLVSPGPPPQYTELALGEFILANTNTTYNPDSSDGPSVSRIDSLSFTGSLTGPGGTIDSILIPNLSGSLAQGQTVVCTLAVYVPTGLRNGDYSGSIVITGYDSLHYEIAETVYALVKKLGDLDVDNDSLDVARDTVDLHTQPAGPVYSPYAKAEFMLVNTTSSYNPDAADGPSQSTLREVEVEVKVEGPGRKVDSECRIVKPGSGFHSSQFTLDSSAVGIYVLNLPESLAVGQAVECTLALVIPVGESLDGYAGWVAISALDTLGYTVRDSFFLTVRGPQPRQSLDSLGVAPIPFKPYHGLGHDAIHFQGLTEGARVIVYDASGQSVWSATESGDGHLKWEAKVASGIYVYLVTSADGKASKVGKLSVIR